MYETFNFKFLFIIIIKILIHLRKKFNSSVRMGEFDLIYVNFQQIIKFQSLQNSFSKIYFDAFIFL